MTATFTRKPAKKQRRDSGVGGIPPVVRRPTGGGDNGGGDDKWGDGSHRPRQLLKRVRFILFTALACDIMIFAVLASIFFALRGYSQVDSSTRELIGDWHPLLIPRIFYLNTAILLLSCLTMELARHNIFREIDALEEWLGMGRPALRHALPWLGATLTLGALFITGQWIAWKQLAARSIARGQPSNPATSFFYLITGLHAAHILLGMAALILCLSVLGWLRRVDLRQIAVDATAWYWHTMSLVWILLLAMMTLGQKMGVQ
jgi:cytochrome c oxidase subunit 3